MLKTSNSGRPKLNWHSPAGSCHWHYLDPYVFDLAVESIRQGWASLTAVIFSNLWLPIILSIFHLLWLLNSVSCQNSVLLLPCSILKGLEAFSRKICQLPKLCFSSQFFINFAIKQTQISLIWENKFKIGFLHITRHGHTYLPVYRLYQKMPYCPQKLGNTSFWRLCFIFKIFQVFPPWINTLNFVEEVKLQNRHEPVKGSIFFKYFCMWLLLSAIGLILHRMTIWAPPRDLKISSLTPWCETGKNLAFHYG